MKRANTYRYGQPIIASSLIVSQLPVREIFRADFCCLEGAANPQCPAVNENSRVIGQGAGLGAEMASR